MLCAPRLGLWAVVCSSLMAAASPCPASEVSLDAKSKALAHYIMAVCDDLNDDSTHAIREYQKSVKYNPFTPAPRLKLGAYYLRLNRINESIAQLKAAQRLAPQDPKPHYMLALVYSSLHKYDLATAEYEAILKTAAHNNPADTNVYMYLGQLYYAEEKYPQAVRQFSKVLQLEPDNTSALYLLGSVYADTNENFKAIDMFRKALEIDSENSDALNSLGYVYAQLGIHLKEAVRMIRQAIKNDPANGAYYDSLGWALYKEGRYGQSLAALQKAGRFIEDEILYDHLGDVYKALKEYALACKYWRRSLDLDPGQLSVKRKIKELEKCLTSRSIRRQK